jgi:hypothetical protein
MKHRLVTGSIPVSTLQNDRLEPYGALSDSVERRLKRTDICKKAAQKFGIEVHNGVYTLDSKYYGTLALDSYPYESKDIRDKAKAMEWECLNGGTRKPKRTSGTVTFDATEKPEKRSRVLANQVERVGPLLIFSGLGVRDLLKPRTISPDVTAKRALEPATQTPPFLSQLISHQPENAHTKDSPQTKVHHNQEEHRQNGKERNPIILQYDFRIEPQYLSAQARSSSHSGLEGPQISYSSNTPRLEEKEMVPQYATRLKALVSDDVDITIDGESARRHRNGESSRMSKHMDKSYFSETKRTYKTDSTRAKTLRVSQFPTKVPKADVDIARRHKELLEEVQKLKEGRERERKEAEAECKKLREENWKLQTKLKLKNQKIKALMESDEEEED